ncbi:MAG TPA: hypothetical protein VMC06_15400 [Opitutaceae bacterium]|nr:hypothetical protein [Opitutaceae bacterium]
MVLFHSRHFLARGRRQIGLCFALLLAAGLGVELAGNWPEPAPATIAPEFALAPPGWPLVLAPLVLSEYLRH